MLDLSIHSGAESEALGAALCVLGILTSFLGRRRDFRMCESVRFSTYSLERTCYHFELSSGYRIQASQRLILTSPCCRFRSTLRQPAESR